MAQRPRTRAHRFGLGVLGLCLLGTTTAGCGNAQKPSTNSAGPGVGVVSCRAEWRTLADSLSGRDEGGNPSDLAPRWNSIVASTNYHATAATAADCGAPLDQARATVEQIDAFSGQVARFDITAQMVDLAAAGNDYLANPLPSARVLHRNMVLPPSKADVYKAMKTLQTAAADAAADMQAGWDEANAADLSDPEAVAHVVKDLRFLSRDSTPFQTALRALKVLAVAKKFQGQG